MLGGVSLVRTMSGAFFKKLPFKNKNKIWGGGLSWSKQGCSMWGAPGFHEERSQLSKSDYLHSPARRCLCGEGRNNRGCAGHQASPRPWPVRGQWLGQCRAFGWVGGPEDRGRPGPAPGLQSVPLSKKKGAGKRLRGGGNQEALGPGSGAPHLPPPWGWFVLGHIGGKGSPKKGWKPRCGAREGWRH